jgi:hypothetical protein
MHRLPENLTYFRDRMSVVFTLPHSPT